MQNLLKILLRYGNFLVFILLEVAAFLLFSYNNAYPRSSILSTSNQVIAWQNEKLSEIKSYFNLKEQNEILAIDNTYLRSQLSQIQQSIDDSIMRETMRLSNYTAPSYLPAKVVQITTRNINNFITINVGKRDSIHKGQGVINDEGIVGIVQTVGPKYSVVMPIINTHTNVSCRFTKNDYIATLQWDGDDYRFATLTDVASHLVVNKGDTIVTSGLSPIFPEGIPVGIVENSTLEEGASYYTISVRLNTNFKRIKYVEVVCNEDQLELEELTNGMD
ncbi:MAG: rod shape-determining protein MreC [Paludibacteraceae bacterium]|nr:rod shape-determining protein MreC [Paludibacteraceae bacterium]